MSSIELLVTNANIITCDEQQSCYPQGFLAIENGKILDLGPMTDGPPLPTTADAIIDAKGALLTPGLIDCHTHCIYAGDRSFEFEMRLQGQSYAQIAKAGGGIKNTVLSTREASFENLYESAKQRLLTMMQHGVTGVEIKSGYGLDLETEIKMLKVARQLAKDLPLTVKTTFLGAHALPFEFSNADSYIDYVCQEVLPEIHRLQLADAVDIFCESIAFNLQQAEKLFETAHQLSIPVKCHAEQLSNMHASRLAARFNALSCDHLEYIDEDAVRAMSKANSVAVLLPGAFYYLQEEQKPPIAMFRDYDLPMAIASDSNPGSSPTLSLPLMMNMACILFGLSPQEALLGVTRNAAKALAMDKTHGSLSNGKAADFNLWQANNLSALSYAMASPIEVKTFVNGQQRMQWGLH